MSGRARLRIVLAALLVGATAVGCATVPTSSPVQVLRKITDGDGRALPPGPVDDSNPLDLIRGFVYASGSSDDRHGAARRFLTSTASSWNDGASLTVIDEQFDTVYAQPPGDTDHAVVRIRGTQLGRLNAAGAFEADESDRDVDIEVAKIDGQWRISKLPSGALVRLSDFRAYYKGVKSYFIDPSRPATIADQRYVPASPSGTLPSRAVEMLLSGPSGALAGAAVSELRPTARLRSNVAQTPDGAVIVDLTDLGDLDDQSRHLLAAQVVQSLGQVNVGRVRLLADGAALLPNQTDLTAADVASYTAEPEPRADVAGMVVVGGRARALTGPELGGPVAGPAGAGGLDVNSAAVSTDGQRLAVVVRQGLRRQLMVGKPGGALDVVPVEAGVVTRPSWTPAGNEVWTVLDGSTVDRVALNPAGAVAGIGKVDVTEVTAVGPISDLRLSRDGIRVLAVVGGRLAVGSVVRGPAGDVAVRDVRLLRNRSLTDVVAADWKAGDQIAVASRRADRPVSVISVDGLDWQPMPTSNLTLPLVSIAAAPSRPLLVTDQSGVWSFGGGQVDSWRQLVGGAAAAVPVYPG